MTEIPKSPDAARRIAEYNARMEQVDAPASPSQGADQGAEQVTTAPTLRADLNRADIGPDQMRRMQEATQGPRGTPVESSGGDSQPSTVTAQSAQSTVHGQFDSPVSTDPMLEKTDILP